MFVAAADLSMLHSVPSLAPCTYGMYMIYVR